MNSFDINKFKQMDFKFEAAIADEPFENTLSALTLPLFSMSQKQTGPVLELCIEKFKELTKNYAETGNIQRALWIISEIHFQSLPKELFQSLRKELLSNPLIFKNLIATCVKAGHFNPKIACFESSRVMLESCYHACLAMGNRKSKIATDILSLLSALGHSESSQSLKNPECLPDSACQKKLKYALAVSNFIKTPAWASHIGKLAEQLHEEFINQTPSLSQVDKDYRTRIVIQCLEAAAKCLQNIETPSKIKFAAIAERLGQLYEFQSPPDFERSAFWFEQAFNNKRPQVELPLRMAQFQVAIKYLGLHGALSNWQQDHAHKLAYAQAVFNITQNHTWATHIGKCHKENSLRPDLSPPIKNAIIQQAIKFFEIGIKAEGDEKASAAYLLWQMLTDHDNFIQKPLEALGYLISAAKLKHMKAMNILALQYSLEENVKEAEFWKTQFTSRNFETLSRRISTTGLELFITSNNNSHIIEFETKTRALQLEKESTERLEQLKKMGVLSPDETMFTNPLDTKKGVCQGMVIEFISRCLPANQNNLEELLKKEGYGYQCTPGVSAISLQAMYRYLFFKTQSENFIYEPKDSAITEDPIVTCNPLSDEERRRLSTSEAHWSRLAPLYALRNQRLIKLPHLGIPGDDNDVEVLSRWLKEPEGYYQIIFNISNTTNHAIAAIKQGQNIYLWDPSIGLIKYAGNQAAVSITAYLSHFWSNNNTLNHELVISRVTLV